MRQRRPFLKQRPTLYFDENIPAATIAYFKGATRWRSRFKFVSALELGHMGRADRHHFHFCQKRQFTLVSLDSDFEDDRDFPFMGRMAGVIIVKASKGTPDAVRCALEQVLSFLIQVPFPKGFLIHTKLICSAEGCEIRGRDLDNKELRRIYAAAGSTTIREVLETFNYFRRAQS
ncbi:MAG: DUF5615 family PIN-like protein [Rhodomicrobium sp.]